MFTSQLIVAEDSKTGQLRIVFKFYGKFLFLQKLKMKRSKKTIG